MRLLTCLSFFLLASVLPGQRIYGLFVLESQTNTVRFRVDKGEDGQFFKVTAVKPISNGGKALKDYTLRMEDGDLVFALKTGKGDFSGQFYAIDPVIGGPLNLRSALPRSMVNAGKNIDVYWSDATEHGLYPGQEYELQLKIALLGGTDCDAEQPRLKLNGPVLAGVAALAGGGVAIGIGQQLRSDSQKDYEIYLDAWEAGRPQQNETDQLFKQAEESAKKSATLSQAGIAASAAGGLALLYFWSKAVKEKRRYKTYCTRASNKAQSNLTLDLSAIGDLPGLRLVTTF